MSTRSWCNFDFGHRATSGAVDPDMSWGVAGAVNDVVRSLRANRRFVESMKARGAARREFRRELGRRGVATTEPCASQAPFLCMHLCLDCGRLIDPPTPLSQARRSTEPTRACPACHGRSVVDLRQDTTLEQLESIDRNAEIARGSGPRRIALRLVALGSALGLPVVLAWMWRIAVEGRVAYEGMTVGFLAVLVLLTANVWLVRWAAETWRRTRMSATPARWSMVRPSARVRRTPVASGTASGEHELVAPLSGRPCLAYEVGIRADGDADAPWGTWTLFEQRRASSLQIGEWSAADRPIHLQMTRTALDPSSMSEQRTRMFCRQRGLAFPLQGQVFETVLTPGQLATAHEAGEHVTVVRSRSR